MLIALLVVVIGFGITIAIVRIRPQTAHDPAVSAGRNDLRMTNQEMATQVDSLPDGTLAVDREHSSGWINHQFAQMWGIAESASGTIDPATAFRSIEAELRAPTVFLDAAAAYRADQRSWIDQELDLIDGRIITCRAGSASRSLTATRARLDVFSFIDVTERKAIKANLRFSNTLLQTEMEASSIGMLVVDGNGRIASFNQRVIEITRVPRELYEQGSDDPVLAAFARLVEDEAAFLTRVDYLYAHPEESDRGDVLMKDGRVLERRSMQLKSPEGESFGRVWFFDDVTEERKISISAVERSNFVTALLDSLPGYFVLMNEQGRLIRWNANMLTLNDFSDAELEGADAFANVVPDSRDEMRTKMKEILDTGGSEIEFGIQTKNYGIRVIHWNGRRTVVNGEALVLAVGMDVTAQRAVEERLRYSEERSRIILNSVNDGIMVQAADTGEFIEINPRMHEMFGYTREEFLTQTLAGLSSGESDAAIVSIADLRTRVRSGATTFDWSCRAKDGREFFCETSVRRITLDDRDVLLSTVRDITERREAQAALSYRDRILHALTLSTAELMKTDSVTDSLPILLRSVGQELRVDRLLVIKSGLAERDPNPPVIRYSWQREHVPQIDFDAVTLHFAQKYTPAQVAEQFEELTSAIPMQTDDVAATTGVLHDILVAGNTKANIMTLIVVDGRPWGMLGIDDTRGARSWTSIEIDALKTLTDVIGALITRQEAQRALRASEDQFRSVSETVLDAIIIIGMDGKIRYWNLAAERIFGFTAAEAQCMDVHRWIVPEPIRAAADAGMEHFVQTGEGEILGTTREVTAKRKDGSLIEVEIAVNLMTVGTERLIVGAARDITARKHSELQITWLARHDHLTGLANRSVFVEAIEQAIARAKRGARGFAVLYLDLDHFKDVNDTLGHPIGDELLKEVARRLEAGIRDIDTVARFGGDEFAVIALDIIDPVEASTLADKLTRAVSVPFQIASNDIHSGASVGIAVYGPDSPSAESLLSHADVALYRAKVEGRGGYSFFTDAMDIEVRARVTMATELRQAMAENQFYLVYQPQVDIESGKIVGLESLIRWSHPKHGIIEPSIFIPTAEQIGLIGELGRWVLREACVQIRKWLDLGVAPPQTAVNVSALQFKASFELEKCIAELLRTYDIPSTLLELELTESILMETSQQHNEVLLRLRALGLKIAIDDFGNGYSSLDYLRRFHVDRIKIAQNFITDLGVVSENAPIVRAALGLGRELGITVVAEGVETVAQLDLLRSWGCREVQGYYFSRPLPADEITNLLRNGLPIRR